MRKMNGLLLYNNNNVYLIVHSETSARIPLYTFQYPMHYTFQIKINLNTISTSSIYANRF